MARETIKSKERVTDGKYKFTVIGIPEKFRLESGHTKRIWVLSYMLNGEILQYSFSLFPSDYMPIVLAIGGKKEGGNVDWDDEDVDGKSFECDLKSVPSKDGKYTNYRFENCQEGIPF